MSKTNADFKIFQQLPVLGSDLIARNFVEHCDEVQPGTQADKEGLYRSVTAEVFSKVWPLDRLSATSSM